MFDISKNKKKSKKINKMQKDMQEYKQENKSVESKKGRNPFILFALFIFLFLVVTVSFSLTLTLGAINVTKNNTFSNVNSVIPAYKYPLLKEFTPDFNERVDNLIKEEIEKTLQNLLYSASTNPEYESLNGITGRENNFTFSTRGEKDGVNFSANINMNHRKLIHSKERKTLNEFQVSGSAKSGITNINLENKDMFKMSVLDIDEGQKTYIDFNENPSAIDFLLGQILDYDDSGYDYKDYKSELNKELEENHLDFLSSTPILIERQEILDAMREFSVIQEYAILNSDSYESYYFDNVDQGSHELFLKTNYKYQKSGSSDPAFETNLLSYLLGFSPVYIQGLGLSVDEQPKTDEELKQVMNKYYATISSKQNNEITFQYDFDYLFNLLEEKILNNISDYYNLKLDEENSNTNELKLILEIDGDKIKDRIEEIIDEDLGSSSEEEYIKRCEDLRELLTDIENIGLGCDISEGTIYRTVYEQNRKILDELVDFVDVFDLESGEVSLSPSTGELLGISFDIKINKKGIGYFEETWQKRYDQFVGIFPEYGKKAYNEEDLDEDKIPYEDFFFIITNIYRSLTGGTLGENPPEIKEVKFSYTTRDIFNTSSGKELNKDLFKEPKEYESVNNVIIKSIKKFQSTL